MLPIDCTLDPNEEYLREHQDKLDGLSEQVCQKYVMVLDSHAVVDPRTVVVVSFHASFADDAVPASASPDYLALWA